MTTTTMPNRRTRVVRRVLPAPPARYSAQVTELLVADVDVVLGATRSIARESLPLTHGEPVGLQTCTSPVAFAAPGMKKPRVACTRTGTTWLRPLQRYFWLLVPTPLIVR